MHLRGLCDKGRAGELVWVQNEKEHIKGYRLHPLGHKESLKVPMNDTCGITDQRHIINRLPFFVVFKTDDWPPCGGWTRGRPRGQGLL